MMHYIAGACTGIFAFPFPGTITAAIQEAGVRAGYSLPGPLCLPSHITAATFCRAYGQVRPPIIPSGEGTSVGPTADMPDQTSDLTAPFTRESYYTYVRQMGVQVGEMHAMMTAMRTTQLEMQSAQTTLQRTVWDMHSILLGIDDRVTRLEHRTRPLPPPPETTAQPGAAAEDDGDFDPLPPR